VKLFDGSRLESPVFSKAGWMPRRRPQMANDIQSAPDS